jgi:hypothetical protein
MQLRLTKENLDNHDGNGGLEISIPGLQELPGSIYGKECPIFIEYYEGKVLIHVWDGKEDPTTITLTNRR